MLQWKPPDYSVTTRRHSPQSKHYQTGGCCGKQLSAGELNKPLLVAPGCPDTLLNQTAIHPGCGWAGIDLPDCVNYDAGTRQQDVI